MDENSAAGVSPTHALSSCGTRVKQTVPRSSANWVCICRDAGKPDVLARIPCHELESWHLGDLNAVEQGLGVPGLAKKQKRAKYRNPDLIANPVQELQRLTNERYQKIAGSRAIGPHLSPDANRSHSFTVFVSGLQRLVRNGAGG